jgi:hypothetical protein
MQLIEACAEYVGILVYNYGDYVLLYISDSISYQLTINLTPIK